MTTHYSLRKRLFIYISLPLLLASAITLSLAFISAWHEVEEVYDAQLVNSARVLLQLMEHELTEEEGSRGFTLVDPQPTLQHKYEKNIAFRLWYKDKLTTQSNNAALFGQLYAPPGFSDQIINNEKWRFFVFIEPKSSILIETSERYSIRYELIFDIIISLIIPSIIFIPLVFLIVWLAIKRNFESILSVSSNVDTRNSDDLSAIPYHGLPREILPLIQAINRLFERLQYSFTREKEFTDHAAHELRTPLAAMKTQAQVIQKRIDNDPILNEDMHYLLESINCATDLVNQLLLLSRLQNERFPKKPINLSECLTDAIGYQSSLHADKGIVLSSIITERLMISGHRESLSIMFSNIIENAMKYTPAKGAISVSLHADGLFVVSDAGPGIAEEDKTKIFERFFRADKTGESGSGIGLSIVRWIADAHQLAIELVDNQPSGLIVKIKFNPLTLNP